MSSVLLSTHIIQEKATMKYKSKSTIVMEYLACTALYIHFLQLCIPGLLSSYITCCQMPTSNSKNEKIKDSCIHCPQNPFSSPFPELKSKVINCCNEGCHNTTTPKPQIEGQLLSCNFFRRGFAVLLNTY